MTDNTNYITKEKRSELELELGNLQNVKRPEILKTIEFAKSMGDLSENAEYHQAREEQRRLEERIYIIQNLLKSAIIVSSNKTDRVGIGSLVTVRKDGVKEDRVYQIVGSEESDMKQGKISHRSPMGSALMGCGKNDSIDFKTPGGVVHYKIIEV